MPGGNKPPAAPPPRHGRNRQIQEPRQRGATTMPADDIIRPESLHALPSTAERATPGQLTRFASNTQAATDAIRVGETLRALRRRAGLSAPQLARAAGMPSTTYKSYEDRFSKPHLPVTLTQRLAPILLGRGYPPIGQHEIDQLAGLVTENLSSKYGSVAANAAAATAAYPPTTVTRDVPVLATRAAEWGSLSVLPEPAITFLPRPATQAANRTLFAVTMADASMAPRFEPGERIYCDPTRPPSLGAYAIAILAAPDGAAACAHVGRLTAMTADHIVLALLNPPQDVRIATNDVATLARVLTTAELLGD